MRRSERIFIRESGRDGVKQRLFIMATILVAGFGLVLYRAYSLQVAPQNQIENLAGRQHNKVLPESIGRGNIYDRHGEELAISVPSFSLVAHPHLIEQPKQMAKQLASLNGLETGSLMKKLTGSRKFVWLKRHLTPKEAELMQNRGEKGLSLVKESQRFYPSKVLAASVLGAVGYDDKGLSGLEHYYNRTLRGNLSQEVATRDARGETIEIEEEFLTPRSSEDKPANLILTIDRKIQFIVEKELKKAVSKAKALGGVALVMNPHNGAILAMASYPTFDPNNYSNYDLSLWKNKAVGTLVEPGSTFKIVTAAAALESERVKPSDTFFCERGSYAIGKRVIHDHEPYGLLTFREIMQHSSNIGFYKISEKVGRDTFYKTIRDFGFGEKTQINFPGEISGVVRPLSSWKNIDQANIAFGQGIGVTALQIANAYATVASGGIRWRPYLVEKIIDEQGKTLEETNPQVVKRVLRKETAEKLTNMLTSVVTEDGTGLLASIPGYSVAGKTGTAQKIDSVTKKYSKTKMFSSFVGYTPATRPALVIFVGIDEPKGMTYGGQIAAPAFQEIGLVALQSLGIPPDRPVTSVASSPKTKTTVLASAEPRKGVSWKEETAGEAITLPNLQGLSIREVTELLSQKGVHTKIEGSGVAISQQPGPGT
ncbi:MAG: penicillin-binding protein, partial [bacterium]|nr:penicillin-binding protein [bacterium]